VRSWRRSAASRVFEAHTCEGYEELLVAGEVANFGRGFAGERNVVRIE
jgi:hypothetical protein